MAVSPTRTLETSDSELFSNTFFELTNGSEGLEQQQPESQSRIDQDHQEFYSTVVPLADKVQELASQPAFFPPATIRISNDLNARVPAYALLSKNVIVWNAGFFKQNKTDLYSQVFILLFERLNLQSRESFQTLNNMARCCAIRKSEYVKSVEMIEHQNALAAQRMMHQGIDMGTLERPVTGSKKVFEDFSLHYAFQQLNGHSKRIGKRFDNIYGKNATTDLTTRPPSPFIGTFPLAFEDLTQKQHKFIMTLLLYKYLIDERGEKEEEARLLLGTSLLSFESHPDSETGCDDIKRRAIATIFSSEELSMCKEIAREHLSSSSLKNQKID